MNIWEDLRYVASKNPARVVHTTMLGRVPYYQDRVTGEWVSSIPAEVHQMAQAHGFEVVAACYKDNTYTLLLR